MNASFKKKIFQQCAMADRHQLLKLLRQTQDRKQAQQARQKLSRAIDSNSRATH
jgi:hypothetical protein